MQRRLQHDSYMPKCYTDLFPSLFTYDSLPHPTSFHSPQNIVQYKLHQFSCLIHTLQVQVSILPDTQPLFHHTASFVQTLVAETVHIFRIGSLPFPSSPFAFQPQVRFSITHDPGVAGKQVVHHYYYY